MLVEDKLIDPSEEDVAQLLKIGTLSNNADVENVNGIWRIVGDPTEGALIVAAKKAGILDGIREKHVRIVEYPFDSDRKRMVTVDEPKE